MYNTFKYILIVSFIVFYILRHAYEVNALCADEIINDFNKIINIVDGNIVYSRNNNNIYDKNTTPTDLLRAIFNKKNKGYLFKKSVRNNEIFSIFQYIGDNPSKNYEPITYFGQYIQYLEGQVDTDNISLPKEFSLAIELYYNPRSKSYEKFKSISETMTSYECFIQLSEVQYEYPFNYFNLYLEQKNQTVLKLMLYHFNEFNLISPCAKMYHYEVLEQACISLLEGTYNPEEWCDHCSECT